MYLKALEIQGFKSFPEKTVLTFENSITAIVGPNGSGKSNIADALLWVMGEQRSKTLRGAKMEDVIFGGTEKRGAMGFAQVTLILDNTDRSIAIDASEIMLTRRYYRSGESEYYINREAVRLKDINSLLMDTGLGRDGYSVIGQGRISEIISNKATDRREVFEEAAGISRFRYRKEEAERKLEKTEENLVRINDKVEELELQVGPLKEQAEVARQYLLLRDRLRVREISVWMATLDKLHASAQAVSDEYDDAHRALDDAHRALDALYASSDSILERMHRKDTEAEETRARLSRAETQAAECDSAAAVIRANIKNSADSVDRMLGDIADAEKRAEDVRGRIRENERRVAELEEALSQLRDRETSARNVIAGCRMKTKSREDAVALLTEKFTRLTVDCRSMDSRIELLAAMEKEYEGFSKAVKTVMREASHGALKGVHGPVANLLRVDDEYALAVETAIGGAMQNIVVDTQYDGRAAIELLKRQDAGRGTFLPLDVIGGAVLDNVPSEDPGFVGVAYELAHFDEKYRGIFASLLGRTVVAETLSDAVRLSKKSNARLRIVTLDGQLINAGGSMTGGSAARGTGMLSRANELSRLREQRGTLDNEMENCRRELDEAKRELAKVGYQLTAATDELNLLHSDTAAQESEKRATQGAADQLRALLDALSGDGASRRAVIAAEEAKAERLKTELRGREKQLEEINARAAGIRAEIARLNEARLELEGRRTKNDRDAQDRNKELLNMERSVARLEQKKLASDLEEKQILDKLWENYELSHTAAQAVRRPVENLPRAAKEINELRRDISALGTPNIGAIDEYQRVSERYEFLTAQRDDVRKAKKELTDIIGDITAEMRDVFLREFRAINDSFKETFLEFFGGGKADLVLEDEDNVLECGIEIKVQPPGKALSSISLLSGGEMAFVAIALYFAIIKVRPTPFCVMDEIEAALDEANVIRYAEYMRRVSDKTQFIVITHRRGTMEEANHLYGVTMQEKGVSKVIALDLAEAQKTIEAAKR
ncbi:MAG TPA: AAA family ATPase [Oscillospiraceae bacterium]|nr:AAA family ATPase [Oscillospiraceae bacterium]